MLGHQHIWKYIHASVHVDGWKVKEGEREGNRGRWYLYINIDPYTCTTLIHTLNSSYRNSACKKMVWDSEKDFMCTQNNSSPVQNSFFFAVTLASFTPTFEKTSYITDK